MMPDDQKTNNIYIFATTGKGVLSSLFVVFLLSAKQFLI